MKKSEGLCGCEALPAPGDAKGEVKGPYSGEAKQVRKRLKNKGKGRHCVFSKSSKTIVRCYHTKKSAQNVSRGFGPGFGVKTRKR